MIDLKGCGTALVTPFKSDTQLDLEAFRKLIRWQLDSGIHFLVPSGTTGESVTLNEEEYRKVIRTCVETAAGAVPVVAGAGTNNTAQAIHLATIAQQEGADALLAVTPYYNKPTQEGLVLHFSKIAESISLPVVLYNVPGRTIINITAETALRLAQVDNIIALKEASGDLGQVMQILNRRPSDFVVLSGDDSLTLPIMAMGGEGIISVASNLIPAEMSQMVDLALSGKWEEAKKIHYRYLDLMELNFIESSPIPVKYALSRMGKLEEAYRLPLCPLSDPSKKVMDQELDKLNLVSSGD
ncbi:MAG: 4-hydroxy-tetrahydrodipicolinate synthase [Acidobacteria bacterium]|jgi:4-hydroxy-tetrahydrodipicolinate synthase|nr:4-hydroxy-tetrahydrodipicolinate synthase [Acidobacteriota bacterium]